MRIKEGGVCPSTPRLVKEGKEDNVYRLKKAVYVKQAPKAWNSQIDSYFFGARVLKKTKVKLPCM